MGLKVGIQMYSVRHAMEKDPVATIGRVAQMGYKYIELANLTADKDPGCGFGAEPEALKAAIEPYGAKVISAHIDPFDKENVERVLEYHKRLGTECLMSKSIDVREETVKRQCELLGYIGEKCREFGIKHCIHTGQTAVYPSGKNSLDIYKENTEEGTLFFELDTYWILRSGQNPIQFIKKYGDRITMIHQKDLPHGFEGSMDVTRECPSLEYNAWMAWYLENMKPEDFAEIGTGVMDIQGIIDATLKYTKAEYFVLEQDFTSLDEFESIRVSMEGIKKLKGLEY